MASVESYRLTRDDLPNHTHAYIPFNETITKKNNNMNKRTVEITIVDPRECIPDDMSVVYKKDIGISSASQQAILMTFSPEIALAITKHAEEVATILKKFADNCNDYDRDYEVTDLDTMNVTFKETQYRSEGIGRISDSSSTIERTGSIAIGNNARC